MKPSAPHARRRVALLGAVLSVGALGACSATSPAETMNTMEPSDGVPADLGDVQIRNLAVVSGGAGKAATVTGTVENSGSEEATLTMAAGDGKQVEASVPAGAVVLLSEDDKLTLEGLEQGPGEVVPMTVTANDSDSTPVSVPVLDPQGYYEDYAPEGWTPTPSETHADEESGEEH